MTVVWHSVVWQYVEPAERVRIDALIEEAGRRRPPTAPLVRVRMEPERTGPTGSAFRVRATWWPGRHEAHLADCHGHGPPVRWTGAALGP